MTVPLYISIIGAGEATDRELSLAYDLGKLVARAGHVLVCGGLGGVMEAAARGAAEHSGTTVGILPTDDRTGANPYLTVSLPTGFSHGRNYLVVKCGDGVIAIGGGPGTMSEIGLALKLGRPVVLLESLDIEAAGITDRGLSQAANPADALDILLGQSPDNDQSTG